MTWLRLEGGNHDPDLAEGLAAQISDPLWALARQWQVGEFAGEDAASPVMVAAEVDIAPLTAFAPGEEVLGAPKLPRGDADRPLEVLVEQESASDDVRLSLELGWLLLRALFGSGVDTAPVRDEYRLALPPDDGLDPEGRAELELLARRSLDGRRLAADGRARALELLGDGAAPALDEWLTATADFVRSPTGPASWQTEPLEYRFRVGAPQPDGEVTLSATEYRGGTLDWYHFSRVPNATGLGARGATHRHDVMALPAPLRFEGMPAARFWAIEDETVSFGDLAGGPEDLVRAIVGAFAAVYHDDWMVVPCHVPAGSVSRVTSLVVHDDYGARHEIPATAVVDGPGRVWRFFELDDVAGPGPPIPKSRPEAPLLLVAPALPDSESGPPLERVDMIRDQAANLAWAIERRAPAASGRPFERDAASSPAEPAESGDAWSYVAYTPVPEHWIPLVPVRGEDEQVHLRRGRVALPPSGVPEERLLPMGRILDASAPMRVDEDAIPDAGVRIERRYQRARGPDGRIHLWVGRRVRTGAWPATARFVADRLLRPDE